MEATAKYDFKATADGELSFAKGKRLKILTTTGNWYRAELNGAEGFVPQNFIDIHLPSWYQEDLSRSDAQEKLMSQPVGAFLVRGSRKAAHGDFSISVRYAAGVQHFKVMRDSRGQYYLWSERFPSLNQLVEHYKHNSISNQSQIFLQEMQEQQREDSDSSSPPPTRPLSGCPQTSTPQQVRALYSFQAEETDELEFNASDIIEVVDCSNQAWWTGRLRGKTGLFPSNYTKPI
uniref:GRB2-related adapter protein 2-like n=1 Tax=Scatophagus argus TaxID=75038 RepID=UPI001ED80EF3|nr:GRB2-related adapter protein 2-like [Scatophagus argus]